MEDTAYRSPALEHDSTREAPPAPISLEEQHARAAGEPSMPPLVPRDVQSTAGLFTGVALYGSAFGGLFALAFAAGFGRVRRASPSRTALWLAAGGVGGGVVLARVKDPAHPPAGRPGG